MTAFTSPLDRDIYLGFQATELLTTTRRGDSTHAVQVIRHVFAEAGTAAGMWLANWYFDAVSRTSTDPAMHAIVDDCIRELEQTYGSDA
ncbi:hypothetical protein [Prauserella cavernicola]|uniref:Uncharacterized protein n=1 Tax=Prauserella cavernicola TaxID=2800127 RepID=A0A934QXS7_9PSEU|nr:hypothetical protein [Prauserella cavernicola]MBK1788285.1 hypothetical protein [Prauserella cavernicola]